MIRLKILVSEIQLAHRSYSDRSKMMCGYCPIRDVVSRNKFCVIGGLLVLVLILRTLLVVLSVLADISRVLLCITMQCC